MTQKEVKKQIKQPNIRLSSSERHEQREYEYWTAQQPGCRLSPRMEKLQTRYTCIKMG